jgi:hypothetical protein
LSVCGAAQAWEQLLIEIRRPCDGDLHTLTVALANVGRRIEDDAAFRHDIAYSFVDR